MPIDLRGFVFSRKNCRQALLDVVPTRLKDDVELLLARLHIPENGAMILAAMNRAQDVYTRLADETTDEKFRRMRNAASQIIRALANHPELHDGSYSRLDEKQYGKIYAVLARRHDPADRQWDASALRDALLVELLRHQLDDSGVDALLSTIHRAPIAPQLEVDEPSVLARMSLLSGYLASHFSTDKEALQAAAVLKAISEEFYVQAPRRVDLQPQEKNKLLLASYKLRDSSKDGYKENSQDRIRRLSSTVTRRLAASIRRDHTPRSIRIPGSGELSAVALRLAAEKPDLANWIRIHAVLGRFAEGLLGRIHSAPLPFSVPTDSDGYVSVLLQPLAIKPAAACPDNLPVALEYRLPLPIALLKEARRITAVSGYDYAEMTKNVRSTMNDWAASHAIRTNLTHLKRLLPDRIDPVAYDKTTQHVLGLTDVSPRDAGIYYFSPQYSQLKRRYMRAVEDVVRDLAVPQWLAEGWSRVEENEGCVGISVRPRPESLRQLVLYVANLAIRDRGKPSLAMRRDRFNARAAYLSLLFLSGTGARPFGDVFPRREELLMQGALALLSEKDSLYYRSTRWVWLDGRIARHLQELDDERYKLERNFHRSFNPELAAFLLNESGNPVAPSISNMKRLIPGFQERWPWPDDILRHHFRSRAWELGCPTDILARAMGHFPKSMTPDGVFATRPIADSAYQSSVFVSRLLDELGFV